MTKHEVSAKKKVSNQKYKGKILIKDKILL